MASEAATMSGTERAALLLLTLGETEAARVLKFMSAKEVQKLGAAMATLGNVSRDDADAVLDGFILEVEDQTAFGVGAEEYVRKVLTQAFGAARADAFIDRILAGGEAKGLDALKWMSAREVAEIVDGEHPQIVAIVLACLDPDQAAEVLKRLPAEQRADVLLRIASLTDVQQHALQEIESLIADKSSAASSARERLGGDKVAAGIVNALDPAEAEALLAALKERDASLGTRIEEMMFVFDSLLEADDRSIQRLLREVSNELLVVALKGCDPRVRDKLLRNMSKRAAALLEEDMEARGPTRLSEVEAAQKEILEIARRLAEAGEMRLGRDGDDYV
jgi:flagellar motor switch protein FliG